MMLVPLKKLDDRSSGSSLSVSFERSSFEEAHDVVVEARVTKTSRGFLAEGTADWVMKGACDRCLEPVERPLHATFEELFEPGEDEEGFLPNENQLNLAPLVRDLVVLNTPTKMLCQETCQGLCPTCGTNRNVAPCSCSDDEIDVRLEVLKKFKMKES